MASLLSDEEQKILDEFRRKKAESSTASKTVTPLKLITIPSLNEEAGSSSSEKSSPAKRASINLELVPSASPSPKMGSGLPQTVASRVKRRLGAAPSTVGTMEEEEEPKGKKVKIDKVKRPMTRAAAVEVNVIKEYSERKILAPLVIEESFWNMELDAEDEAMYGTAIGSFQSMLEFQGWERMLTEPIAVSDKVVFEFYESMSFVPAEEDCPPNNAILTWRGNIFRLSPEMISAAMEIPMGGGYDILVKRKSWPKGKGHKSRTEVM